MPKQCPRDRLESEQARALRELDELTQALMDELGSYAVGWKLPTLGTTGQEPIARYAFIARGISLSGRPAVEKFRSLKEISLVIQEALFSR